MPKREIEKMNAPMAIVELTKKHSGMKIITLGSLTNLAIALQIDPQLVDRTSIHMMGGAFARVGNRSALGEANIV